MRLSYWLVAILCAMLFISCEKEPGEGGRASITGKVYIQDYNGDCSEIRDEYYGINQRVFIIAGDDPSYFQDVRTGPDGTFWFQYLRKGKYQVYALSDDCDAPGETAPVFLHLEIKERKQELLTQDIVVIR